MNTGRAAIDLALEAWLEALASRGEAEAVAAAVEDRARVERASGLGPSAGRVVEVIDGAENIGRWLALTPPSLRFSLAGRASPTGGGDGEDIWQIAYTVTSDDFHNSGMWYLRLGGDGRIATLRHVPRPLGASAVEERRDPAPWRTYVIPLDAHDDVCSGAHTSCEDTPGAR